MIPDGPDQSDHPTAWWQVPLLFSAVGLITFLALIGAWTLLSQAFG